MEFSVIQATSKTAVLFTLLFATNLYVSSAAAADKPYIFDMWDQFVISLEAAKACSPPSATDQARHDANFGVVTVHVSRTLAAAPFNKSGTEVESFLGGRKAALAQQAAQKISQLGCGNPDVQIITRRYKVQVDWQPPGN
jgi:hypothetical protein